MLEKILENMKVRKVSCVHLWTQSMRNQYKDGVRGMLDDDVRDIINPRLDFGQIDWEWSTRFSFVHDVVGEISGFSRTLLYEHYYAAEMSGDETGNWLMARFSDDPVLLGFFLNQEENGDIVLIAAMRMFAVLERSPLFRGSSLFNKLFDGLRRLDEERLDLFFRFLCDDDEGRVRGMRSAFYDHRCSKLEHLITLSFNQ